MKIRQENISLKKFMTILLAAITTVSSENLQSLLNFKK